METWDAIRSRQNVRQFDERPVPTEVLDRALEAGRRSPSSSNKQRWDFVVVTEPEILDELSEVWQGAGHVARSTATIALIAPVESDPAVRESIQYDLGQATMSIMLAATDAGLGSGHAAVRDQDRAREVLGLPADRFCAWLIALGYPASGPLRPLETPKRRPFDEVVHREGW
ncbi:MAG TPA: nitroreductase family protein [Acidimicrobiia bacterium]|nr:nitroreductase family protein [Acidimicrobiia bacterium]